MKKMKFSISAIEMYNSYENKKYSNITVLFFSLLYNDLITYEIPYKSVEKIISKNYILEEKNDRIWVRENERVFKLVDANKIQETLPNLFDDEKKCLLELFKYKNNIFKSNDKLYEIDKYLNTLYKENILKKLFNYNSNKIKKEEITKIRGSIKSIIEEFNIEDIKSIIPYIFYTEDYKILINKIKNMKNKKEIYSKIYKEYLDNIEVIDYLARGNKTTW